jgi:hypothetical protein
LLVRAEGDLRQVTDRRTRKVVKRKLVRQLEVTCGE